MEQKQPEKKKHGKQYALVGGVLVMLLVCYLLGVATGKRGGDAVEGVIVASTALAPATPTLAALERSETPGPTETAEPTWTPTLTATPQPTLTATPEPTETAEPTRTATPHPTLTATPVPTATAVPTETAWLILTLAEWDQWTRGEIEIIADAALTMGSLMMKPLPEDTKWVALVDLQVAKLREADAGLRDIVPPEKVRDAHEMLLSASGDFLLSAEYALKGAIEQDRDLLEEVTEYMTSADAKFNLFRLMIEAMTP